MKTQTDKYKRCTRENARRIAGILQGIDNEDFAIYGSRSMLKILLEGDERMIVRFRIYSNNACDGRHFGHLYDILCSVARRTKWKYFCMGKIKKNTIEVRFEL